MKKVLIPCSSALLLFLASCVGNLDDKYTVNPKAPEDVPASTLFTNAERDLGRTLASASVNVNPFRMYTQYWAQTTYFDESIYDIQTRAINRTWWNTLYRDVLADFEDAKRLTSGSKLLAPEVKQNQLAAIEVMEIYTWSVLVDTFGDVPYSQALSVANFTQPKYDDDKVIYADLLKRLNAVVGQFDDASESFGDADIILQGNVGQYKKFANSLKLRLAMRVSDVPGFTSTDGKTPKQMIQDAVTAGVLSSNADDVQLNFLPNFPSANPVWEDLVQSGRKDFVGADTYINALIANNDPRIDEYFTPKPDTTAFIGGEYGSNNSYNSYSHPGDLITKATAPGVLLSYSEVEFLLAEAAANPIVAVGSDPESHYNAGVTASIEKWGNSTADASTYLAQATVAFTTASGDFRQKIGRQKWFALYDQPVEAWTEWRRLDSPNLVKPAGALTDIPLRFTYPTTEPNLNSANYAAAAAAIGGDVVTSKLFWDVR
jgi:Starch-binding associating with outer membrane